MNNASKHLGWVATGLLLSLGSGPMALADDTDLFIANADPAVTGALPNILFVMDTSGSMRTEVKTQENWDPDLDFEGCYRSNALYFSVTGAKPGCTSNNYIWKSANRCANMADDIAAFGRYDDNFLQWRNWYGSNNDRWVALDGNRKTRPLECQLDAGVHGDGGSNKFAADGGPGPFWGNDSYEPGWNQDYAIYDGNWLNWFESGGEVLVSRLQVMKNVTSNLLNNIDGVNVGLMRFQDYTGDVYQSGDNNTGEEGGVVVHAMEDIATARANIIAKVNNLPADSWTPLSEVMYEAGQYLAGRSVDYGNSATDPDSVAESRVGGVMSSNTYDSPLDFACQKNFVVLLTDGEPTKDTSANSKITSLPDFDDVNTTGGACDTNGVSGQGHCLDDMAEYMFLGDMSSTLDGRQSVTTYTIGFTVDLPILASTAARGGGEYKLADDTASLASALTDIVSDILDEATSFTAPAVPVNAFNRTQNLTDVFVSVFEPSTHAHWNGNLKKYKIEGGRLVGQDGQPAVNPATGFFYSEASQQAFSFWSAAADGDRVTEGGAASQLPVFTDRRIYTNMTGDSNVTLVGVNENELVMNDPDMNPDDMGVPGDDDDLLQEVIAWTMGLDVKELINDPSSQPQTRKAMGDPLHVRPVAVIYGGTEAAPISTVFTSTNDGILHAINPDTGAELWGFIPERMLERQYELYLDPVVANKRYGLDGEIRAYIQNNNLKPGIQTAEGEKVFLVFGMRRGGDAIFAMEVTDPANPRLAWVVDANTSGLENLGQTWSTPNVARVNIGDYGGGGDRDVVIIGGGYDDGQDSEGYRTDAVGNSIYMLDLETGDVIWSAGNGNSYDLELDGSGDRGTMEHSIPAPIRVADLSGDGLADRMYAADMGGRIWRFDINNGEDAINLVDGGLLATVGAADLGGAATAADVRRFYAAPDIVAVVDTEFPYISVNVGSGHRASPLSATATDEFYAVRDFNPFNTVDTDSYPEPVTRSDLVDVTDWGNDAYPTLASDDAGWRLSMVQAGGEKILTESIAFDGTVFFTSFAPGNPGDTCSTAAGTNRVYRVDVKDGAPPPTDDPYDPTDDPRPEDRITTLKQGGIAPETILLFTEGSDPTGCAGVECFDPGLAGGPSRTYWFQDETQ